MTTFWVKHTGSWSENPGGAGNVPSTAGVALASAYAATQEATPPTDDDVVLFSDLHRSANTLDFYLNVNGSIANEGLLLMSVSDTDSAIFSPGAEETGDDIRGYANNLIYGVDLKSSNTLVLMTVGGRLVLSDLRRGITGSVHLLTTNADGQIIECNNVVFGVAGAIGNRGISVTNGGTFINRGMTMQSDGSAPAQVYAACGVNGGANITSIGCDFSLATTSIVNDTYAVQATSDITKARFYKCEIGVGVPFVDDTFLANGALEAIECDDSTGDAQYRFQIQDRNGTAVEETTKYRADDDPMGYDGTTKMSIKVVTTANASKHRPFTFVLPASFADLSASASDVAQIYLACTNTLDNLDVWATMFYPDGTIEVDCNIISSCPSDTGSFALDPLASGTTLTDDVGSDWRDGGGALSGYNEYLIQLDTSGDAGAKGVPRVEISVGKASETIYFGSEIDFV